MSLDNFIAAAMAADRLWARTKGKTPAGYDPSGVVDYWKEIVMGILNEHHARPAREFYDAAKLNDELVWRICDGYTHHILGCSKCPHSFEHENYGASHHGCRMMAEEAIAIILEAKEFGLLAPSPA